MDAFPKLFLFNLSFRSYFTIANKLYLPDNPAKIQPVKSDFHSAPVEEDLKNAKKSITFNSICTIFSEVI